MKKVYWIVISSLLAISLPALAQEFEVPKNYTFSAKEDYPKYEQDVLNTIDWLERTPWKEQTKKRREANTFCIKWITGCPYVKVELNTGAANLSDTNPELLTSYLYGYARYSILNKINFDKDSARVAGIRTVIAKYNRQPDHNRDPKVEQLMELDKDGKLAYWATNFFDQN